MDRNDRRNLPGYDELIARGNYHRMVGGPDHLDSVPAMQKSEPVGTVFGFIEPAQSEDSIEMEEPFIFSPACSSTIPTVERHRQIVDSPPLLKRNKQMDSNVDTVEPDCAPSFRHSTLENGNYTLPSFTSPTARSSLDPKKAQMAQKLWEKQGHGSVDSGLGSGSIVSFPSGDSAVESLSDDVVHMSIKEEDEPPVTRKISISPPVEPEREENVLHGQARLLDNQELNGNTLLHATQKFNRNISYFQQDSDLETNMHHLLYADKDDVFLVLLDDLMSYHMLDIVNKRKQTVLHIAALMNKPKICRAIMAHGACVDVRDVRGNTPLHIACEKGHVECVEVLSKHLHYSEVKHMAYQVPFRCIPQNLELRNYAGETCLHLAAANGHYDILHYLVHDLHANVDAQEGKRGLTALLQCVERRDARMLMYLVQQCQANIHTRTYDRKNALELAEGRGYTDIANLLRAIGAEADSSSEEEEDSDWIEEDLEEMAGAN